MISLDSLLGHKLMDDAVGYVEDAIQNVLGTSFRGDDADDLTEDVRMALNEDAFIVGYAACKKELEDNEVNMFDLIEYIEDEFASGDSITDWEKAYNWIMMSACDEVAYDLCKKAIKDLA